MKMKFPIIMKLRNIMKFHITRKIRNATLLLLCSALIGTALLTLAFLLPVEGARAHVEESLYEMLEIKEDENGDERRRFIVGLKENFTDTLMVQNALEHVEGKNALEHAMYIFHHDLQDDTTWMTEKSLSAFLRRGTDGMYLKEYSKYWHGYLIYLKPLLICMSWKHVETFMLIFQLLLLGVTVAVSVIKKQAYLGCGIVFTALMMKPLYIWFSPDMSVCFSIALTAVMTLFLFGGKLKRKDWFAEFFLMIGIVTAYLDFLTYPVVTLGIPLCVWLVQNSDENIGVGRKLKSFLGLCVSWAVGYVGMWGMKWILAEATCRTGTLRNAVWSIIFRTEPLDGYHSALSGVKRTVQAVFAQYDAVFYWVIFGLALFAAAASCIASLLKARNARWGITVSCLLAAGCFPFGWLILTQNHTAIHCSFTFRIMGVSFMALCCVTMVSVLNILNIRRTGEKETKTAFITEKIEQAS